MFHSLFRLFSFELMRITILLIVPLLCMKFSRELEFKTKIDSSTRIVHPLPALARISESSATLLEILVSRLL